MCWCYIPQLGFLTALSKVMATDACALTLALPLHLLSQGELEDARSVKDELQCSKEGTSLCFPAEKRPAQILKGAAWW